MQMQNQKAQQIDAKALTILKEQMEQEAVACQKYEAYAGAFMDQTLSTHARTLANCHKQRFENLFNYLNSHN